MAIACQNCRLKKHQLKYEGSGFRSQTLLMGHHITIAFASDHKAKQVLYKSNFFKKREQQRKVNIVMLNVHSG